MPKLIALRPMTYKTRRLQAGDGFDAPEPIARILRARRKVRDDAEAVEAAAEPMPAPPADGTLASLRAEAEAAGIAVDRRWGALRLRQEIEAMTTRASVSGTEA